MEFTPYPLSRLREREGPGPEGREGEGGKPLWYAGGHVQGQSTLLAVEADGGQHAAADADRLRAACLESRGWRLLRFRNNDILANTEGVVGVMLRSL